MTDRQIDRQTDKFTLRSLERGLLTFAPITVQSMY